MTDEPKAETNASETSETSGAPVKCEHEPLEIFRPGSESPWSDDPLALIVMTRGGVDGASLKIHVCRRCGVVYSSVKNWPIPTSELETENARLRAELDALKSKGAAAGGDADTDEE